MKVLFVASEGVPFAKTGGLADVIGSLPKALQQEGLEVGVIMPKYAQIPQFLLEELELVGEFRVWVGWRQQYCGLHRLVYEGIPFYFIDNLYYFDRPGHYGYYDDGERFAFFCRAVLEVIPYMDFQPDVLHTHDWHTAMIGPLLKEHYAHLPHYQNIANVFTIHNLKYQGVFPQECLWELLGLGLELLTVDKLEFYGNVNFLKGGIVYSDMITTVSPTYAEEIQTIYFGEQLEGLLSSKSHSLVGILNGLDYVEYDPASDANLFKNYHRGALTDKRENKKKLQEKVGLEQDGKVPLVGMVTRLVDQKGLDLIMHVLDEIMALDVQLVILGTGDYQYENFLRHAVEQYQGRMSVNIFYSEPLARQIYAGADLFLMPSRFEPCGLSQLISMRYGTLPIARETGGLKDTVLAYNEDTDEGWGFTFSNYNAHDMLYTIKRAVEIFQNKSVWTKLRKRAMSLDFSWEQSAKEYIKVYEQACQKVTPKVAQLDVDSAS